MVLLRVRHETLVVLLRRLLVVLRLGAVVLELLLKVLDQRNHAVALAVLRRVRAPRLRRRRGSSTERGDLHEHRRISSRRLLLRQVRAVELEQLLLRLLQQLLRHVVLSHELRVLRMLRLALLRSLRDSLVEVLDLGLSRRDLVRRGRARLLRLLDERRARRDRVLEVLLRRLALLEILVAEGLLRVVILLLRLE